MGEKRGKVVCRLNIDGESSNEMKQESMSPPSADMICDLPSSCRVSRIQAPTVNFG